MSIRTLAAFSIVNISILVAGYAHAAPRAKTMFRVAFVAAGHLVCHDERLSLKAAKEEAVEMNRLRIDSTDKHFVIVAGDDQ